MLRRLCGYSYTPQVPASAIGAAGMHPTRNSSADPQVQTLRHIGRRQQVQDFLRKLTGISVMALVGVISGQAQTSQPAQSTPAAPEAKKKNYKDQQEFTLYDSAVKEADANKKLA